MSCNFKITDLIGDLEGVQVEVDACTEKVRSALQQDGLDEAQAESLRFLDEYFQAALLGIEDAVNNLLNADDYFPMGEANGRGE